MPASGRVQPRRALHNVACRSTPGRFRSAESLGRCFAEEREDLMSDGYPYPCPPTSASETNTESRQQIFQSTTLRQAPSPWHPSQPVGGTASWRPGRCCCTCRCKAAVCSSHRTHGRALTGGICRDYQIRGLHSSRLRRHEPLLPGPAAVLAASLQAYVF